MKILDYTDYYLVHLIEWTTVIDLTEELNYLKSINVKGEGIERCESCDEIACKQIIY
jgi:hypothetical protein